MPWRGIVSLFLTHPPFATLPFQPCLLNYAGLLLTACEWGGRACNLCVRHLPDGSGGALFGGGHQRDHDQQTVSPPTPASAVKLGHPIRWPAYALTPGSCGPLNGHRCTRTTPRCRRCGTYPPVVIVFRRLSCYPPSTWLEFLLRRRPPPFIPSRCCCHSERPRFVLPP